MSERKIICFSGIDGSGKSTHAKALIVLLRKSNHKCKYIRLRWKPILSMPYMAFLRFIGLTKVYYINKNSTKVYHREYYKNKAIASIWKIIVFLDSLILVLVKLIFPLYISRNTIFILDRYIIDIITDVMADLRTSKIGLPLYLLIIMCPKPSISFLLDVNEQIAFNRKNDILNLHYLRIRRRIYRVLAKYFDYIVINTLQDFNENQKAILNNIKRLIM